MRRAAESCAAFHEVDLKGGCRGGNRQIFLRAPGRLAGFFSHVGSQERLRAAQEPPRAAQERPKSGQERPKIGQERPRPAKTDPRSPQEVPRATQEPSRATPGRPRSQKALFFLFFFSMFFDHSTFATKTAGKSILVPEGPAKSAQEPSKSGQDRPKSTQDRPRMPQERP